MFVTLTSINQQVRSEWTQGAKRLSEPACRSCNWSTAHHHAGKLFGIKWISYIHKSLDDPNQTHLLLFYRTLQVTFDKFQIIQYFDLSEFISTMPLLDCGLKKKSPKELFIDLGSFYLVGRSEFDIRRIWQQLSVRERCVQRGRSRHVTCRRFGEPEIHRMAGWSLSSIIDPQHVRVSTVKSNQSKQWTVHAMTAFCSSCALSPKLF